jgi:hypothetical protein
MPRMLEKFTDYFREGTSFESGLRTGVTALIILYVILYGTVFEAKYPTRLVELYAFPWWRLLIVSLVALGAWWCPRVGLALGVAVFFYLSDMHILTSPFTNKPNSM